MDGCDNTCMIEELYNCVEFDDAIGYRNCTLVILDTNSTDPGSVDSVYFTSEDTFQLTLDLIQVSNFTNEVNYTLIFSKLTTV